MSNESKGRQEETLASGRGGGGKVRDEGRRLRSRNFELMR